jgi:adenine-specific DNA-methyltransferase
LNGGLFDCLDRENEDGKVLYADGFSRNPKKQSIVPDFLFFGAEEEYDLNKIYGTKNKRYTVHGLIDLLSHYKFTVSENTPIEEEVALDPELLGKVFENLLASYNPETQTTARKQTGSFYTPREIVNYMVDESLKAYLEQALTANLDVSSEDAKVGLDILFAYTENEHAFTDGEKTVLIRAIDTCKIFDPACGSGAFPMGVLHKMVHILHKLDPKNEQWKQRQIDKVDKLIEEARDIPDSASREQVIAGLEQNQQDIEDAFGSNELDYGRKLYLIENCIYGVDIQPIAVQIAKLRFFISLVIDQKKQPDKENFGIRALPNLETKFVAANTLIGLERLGQG